jgi:hypothetical protein
MLTTRPPKPLKEILNAIDSFDIEPDEELLGFE